MFYELRGYDVDPDQWDAFIAWGDEHIAPVLFDQFGFRLVGRWEVVPKAGETPPATNYHWILAWESEAEMHGRWAAVFASDSWKAAWGRQVDPATGKSRYITKFSSTLLRPLPLSPLQ
jgi:hypothetical protein